jgi:hypothetical protein
MTPRWRAFTFWQALPYIFCGGAFVTYLLLHDRGPSTLDALLDWNIQRIVLVPASVTAVLGTVILWRLPIRVAWLGMLVGLVLALGIITLCSWFEMILWGGFEEDGGIFLAALALTLPSCLAGAYAGLLRSREQPSHTKPDATSGWWPSSRP